MAIKLAIKLAIIAIEYLLIYKNQLRLLYWGEVTARPSDCPSPSIAVVAMSAGLLTMYADRNGASENATRSSPGANNGGGRGDSNNYGREATTRINFIE